jgi:hypothetical protein
MLQRYGPTIIRTVAPLGAHRFAIARSLHLRDWLFRVGNVAVTLALFVQLTLPFVPMPQMADEVPSSLDRAAGIWGLANICLAPGERQGRDGDKQVPSANHDCPFCQLSQQIAGLLLPCANALTAPLPAGGGPVVVASLQITARFDLSASPPRAPPLV